jgi:hypothetical protein
MKNADNSKSFHLLTRTICIFVCIGILDVALFKLEVAQITSALVNGGLQLLAIIYLAITSAKASLPIAKTLFFFCVVCISDALLIRLITSYLKPTVDSRLTFEDFLEVESILIGRLPLALLTGLVVVVVTHVLAVRRVA